MKEIAIIGGGAGGLACAAQLGPWGHVCVYEATDRVGRPILASGNGRCNFSNASIDPAVYNNPEYVAQAMQEFEKAFNAGECENGVVGMFSRLGLMYREEGEGRLYPLANKASVVLDILRASCREGGVQIKCNSRVAAVEPPREDGGKFTLRMADGVFERADYVIIACGGNVTQDLLPEEFAFNAQRPVLCSLATSDTKLVRELDNIRVKGAVALKRNGQLVATETGEIMFRKYGVSGICTFNLSRFAQPGDVLSIDFLPGISESEMMGFLSRREALLRMTFIDRLTYEDFFRGMLLPRVSDVLMKDVGLHPEDEYSNIMSGVIARKLKGFELEVKGPGDVEHAQVTRGGLDPSCFDPSTMRSINIPGLYAIGEALDIDGPCGGYNLHWAFMTGMLAATACASSIDSSEKPAGLFKN